MGGGSDDSSKCLNFREGERDEEFWGFVGKEKYLRKGKKGKLALLE